MTLRGPSEMTAEGCYFASSYNYEIKVCNIMTCNTNNERIFGSF